MYKKGKEEKEKMQVITINVPSIFLDKIDYLREQGFCPSRSEFIRQSIVLAFPQIEEILKLCKDKPFITFEGKKRGRKKKEKYNDDDLPFNIKVVKVMDKNPNGHLKDKISKTINY